MIYRVIDFYSSPAILFYILSACLFASTAYYHFNIDMHVNGSCHHSEYKDALSTSKSP